jgi:hypothetical protein
MGRLSVSTHNLMRIAGDVNHPTHHDGQIAARHGQERENPAIINREVRLTRSNQFTQKSRKA